MDTKALSEAQIPVPSPLFLGRDGEWWDFWLVLAGILAVIVAALAAAATIGSMKAHKREADTANAELKNYKAETDRRVREANTAGIAAGLAAADVQVAVDHSKAEIAKAQAEAAQANADAARANERAADLENRAANLRLQLEKTRASFASRQLTDQQIEKLKMGLSGYRYRILLCSGSDPEAKIYSANWQAALFKAGQQADRPLNPCGGMTYGGGKVDTVVLWIRGKDAQTITQEPLYKAIHEMGFVLGFSSEPNVPGGDYDASIEIPSWSPPSVSDLQRADAGK